MSALDEKRKSLSNSKDEIREARVLANYMDPGLSEQTHFDLLSRFVIVMLESTLRVPTNNKWTEMFAIVQRPKQLWIDVVEGESPSPNTQKRSDALGNINVGLPDSFSTAGIPQIDKPYQLGEVIKIKKLNTPLRVGQDNFFVSKFAEGVDPYMIYGSWHTQGSTLPYFVGNQARIDSLRVKPIYQPFSDRLNTFGCRVEKFQYEAMALTISSDSNISNYMGNMFGNSLSSAEAVYNANGGYIFGTNNYVNLISCEYIDMNENNKQRTSSDSCLPLVVASVGVWPTPQQRTLSSISYNPSYAVVTQS